MDRQGDGALTIRLFGSPEVFVDGVPLAPLHSRKELWPLALLTLRDGRAIERSWLAEMLWPEQPADRSLATLRRELTDLRRALGPAASFLRSPSRSTLRLELPAGAADVTAFDEAIARGDPASLELAVGLYRGPLLEGTAEIWALEERVAREQAYLQALETLAEAAARRGELAVATGYLRRVVALEPLRESAQRALMSLLAADGSYAAAMRVYRDLRLLLRQELNAEPSSETHTLFDRLCAEAKAPTRPDPAGANPRPDRRRKPGAPRFSARRGPRPRRKEPSRRRKRS
jgi:DNA-binding SARP family transcriptional activator